MAVTVVEVVALVALVAFPFLFRDEDEKQVPERLETLLRVLRVVFFQLPAIMYFYR